MAWLRTWLREPLLHFALIGGLLFVVFGGEGSAPETDEVVISEAQVRNLAALFERTWRRPPGDDELEALIRERVDEEILAREARALGLDKDDPVIRRRLRQKMEFLSEDLVPPEPPSDAELEAYLEVNRELFERPGRITFTQVFLNPERRGEALALDAARLLERLNGGDPALDPMALGDPSLIEPRHQDLSPADVARLFGLQFADRLRELPRGRWAGPIRSPFGSHLVRVDARSDAVLPPLEEVRDDVIWEIQATRREAAREAFIRGLRERYRVTVERPRPSVASAEDDGKP